MNERPIPSAAMRDPRAVEMLRVWLAEGKLHCSLKVGSYVDSGIEEEKAWGIILADVSRHIGDALQSAFNYDEDVAFKIKDYFNEELASPTTPRKGALAEQKDKKD